MTNDDPKLTAYALNELEDSDRAQVEGFLATSEPARRFVEDTRQTVAMLTRSLQSSATPSLTSSQKDSIAAATVTPQELSDQPTARRRPAVWVRWALASAACATMAAGGISIWNRKHPELNRNVANVGIETQPTSHPETVKATIAALVERAQDRIRHRDYKNALAVLSQILQLDPVNDYAYGAYPLVNDLYQLQDKSIPEERRDREIINQLNSTAERTIPYEDVLRYPENWPDLSLAPTAPPMTTRGNTLSRAGIDQNIGGYIEGSITMPTVSGLQITGAEVAGGSSRAAPLSEITSAQNSIGFTQSPSTGIPGGIAGSGGGGGGRGGGGGNMRNSGPFAGGTRDSIYALSTPGDKSNANPKWSGDSILVPSSIEWGTAETTGPANESYAPIHDNTFQSVAAQPLSTFSIDVDTASYSNIRRFLNDGQLPPPDAVRIEEMLNYFPYNYEKPKPDSKEPFAATVEIAGCPWNSAHRLARVAIKGREIAHDKRPVSNLVFLIDVSGSMNEPKRLPMVKEGLKLMVNELTENDRISIVVYAGNAGLVLPSTCADPINKQTILNAIENLSAGGSTNGGEGIELAYKIAAENFIKGGTNRVLLATDGDWNVGVTDQSSLINLIQDKAKSGVFLSVLGYGFGNLKDSTMEKLADKGNGHYAYIDSLKESRKVLVEEMSSTLVTIAKDVKIQIEFNPAKVESYRLLGYEKRLLRKEDFNNDKVDAGEIGAGHCVTALYEIVPGSKPNTAAAPAEADVDPLKYQKHAIVKSDDLMTLKLRYKQPDGDKSTKLEFPAADQGISYAKASEDFKFSAAVAQFGMILRNSPHKGNATLDGVLELADEGKGKDEKGYRAEFLEMVKKAKALSK